MSLSRILWTTPMRSNERFWVRPIMGSFMLVRLAMRAQQHSVGRGVTHSEVRVGTLDGLISMLFAGFRNLFFNVLDGWMIGTSPTGVRLSTAEEWARRHRDPIFDEVCQIRDWVRRAT